MKTMRCSYFVWGTLLRVVLYDQGEKQGLYSGRSITFKYPDFLCTGCVRIQGLAAMDGSQSESLIACLNFDARGAS